MHPTSQLGMTVGSNDGGNATNDVHGHPEHFRIDRVCWLIGLSVSMVSSAA